MSQSDEKTWEDAQSNETSDDQKTLRLWPAVILVIIGILSSRVTDFFEDAPSWLWMVVAFGPLLCSLFALVWWTFFSRTTKRQRIYGLIGIIGAGSIVLFFLDQTMYGPVIMMITLPLGMTGFVVGLYLARWLPLSLQSVLDGFRTT